MRTRTRSIRRRGRCWTVEALPADPWRNLPADAAARMASNWGSFGAAPPRDSEAARRSPITDGPDRTDPGEHNRGVRRAHRAARARRGRR